MIIKCPNCNGALEYEPISNQMSCKFCDSKFDVTDFEGGFYVGEEKEEARSKVNSDMEEKQEAHISYEEACDEMMECNVYTCSTCGARLMVNDVEAATFCAYCGQPTIVFDRVSNLLKPEYIVPFVITKERAGEIIHQVLKKAPFAPTELKRMKADKIRGIYIPFWIVDANYESDQTWRRTIKNRSGDEYYTYHDRASKVEFKDITICASEDLKLSISERLEPYNLRAKKPFEIGYMQGFYADTYDYGRDKMYFMAMNRARDLFIEEMERKFLPKGSELVHEIPQFEIIKSSYVLLPAWFITYRYEGAPHTLIINGQTGKIIGGIPIQKSKFVWLVIILAVISLMLSVYGMIVSPDSLIVLYGILTVPVVGFTVMNFMKAHRSLMRSKEVEMIHYIRNRQDEDDLK